MRTENSQNTILLKQVLDNLTSPEKLDNHPWVDSNFVRQFRLTNPTTIGLGESLAKAVIALFIELMPTTPPRKGKRIDTNWAEFGLLAALYFAPAEFGLITPSNMRDAWNRIDSSIQLYLKKNRVSKPLEPQELEQYYLVSAEPEMAPRSTLSDWQKKGIADLEEIIRQTERNLTETTKSSTVPSRKMLLGKYTREISIALIALVMLLLVVVGVKGYRVFKIYNHLMESYANARLIEANTENVNLVAELTPILSDMSGDITALRAEVYGPPGWVADSFAWVPVHGKVIAAMPELLDMADMTIRSADIGLNALAPVYQMIQTGDGKVSPKVITKALVTATDELTKANEILKKVDQIRAGLDPSGFSSQGRIMLSKLDAVDGILGEGYSAAIVLPELLGAARSGPKTYLVLIQNEDELRATGGFITSVGSFMVSDGELLGLQFDDSSVYEDWSRPYPASPWQVEKYMNIPVTLIRDSNWSPNFPESASLAEYLFSVHAKRSVDGVIAIDQQALVIILEAIGPVQLEGLAEPVDSKNVIRYMRSLRQRPDGIKDKDWDRKAFIENLANAILQKILAGDGFAWKDLLKGAEKATNQRHILFQSDLETAAQILQKKGWDGAIISRSGDFLMTVDTNVGYDKVNSQVRKNVSYDIDLSDLASPKSTLVVFHENKSPVSSSCKQWGGSVGDVYDYPINHCYFNYFRVYLPTGAILTGSNTKGIQSGWLIGGQPLPPHVDTLDMIVEKVDGFAGFGSMLVIPGGMVQSNSFNFSLPAKSVNYDNASGLYTYQLTIQKQAGTRADSLTLRIHLPPNAVVHSVLPKTAQMDGKDILIETTLTSDVVVQVAFSTN